MLKNLALASVLCAGLAHGELLTPVWVVLGDQGQAAARVVVNAPTECPVAIVDGATRPMTLRPGMPAGLRPACELPIPAAARSVTVAGKSLVLPKADPPRIVVIGDTGCRIKGARAQECNDMTKWPLQEVTSNAAASHPDLVVHVGDYLYREDACPATQQAKCGGTPVGDNWETWNADFFAPAANLLAAAPWAFSRGNHEDCKRSWRGWFYYLDPRPMLPTCSDYTQPYVVKTGKLEIAMLDSASTVEDGDDEAQVSEYTSELRSLHLAPGAWLVDHHPFWGVKPGPKGKGLATISRPLEMAWDRAGLKGVDVVLSGHTHLFAVLDFDGDRPVQIVAGDGGTELSAPIPHSVNGVDVAGAMVKGSETRIEFGYTLFERAADHWKLTLESQGNQPVVACTLTGRHTACESITAGK